MQELDEFNDDMAGRNTGRMRSNVKPEADQKDDSTLDVLDAMELAAMVWHETFERIAVRLAALEEASSHALQEAQQRLNDIEQRATVLPDGRRAYLSRDGKEAFYEDGTRMSDAEKAKAEWRPGAPDWESRKDAERRHEEIRRYRERLEGIRRRFDAATPGTVGQEELERLEAELERDVPESVRQARDRLTADRPDQPAYAATQAKSDIELSQTDRDAAPAGAAPKISFLTPS